METRGWKLYICFGLLSVALAKDVSQSVPGAREDESTFTEFTLVSDSKSHLFSSCFDELNTIEATLHAIEVSEDKEYIRYLIDSDTEVTWEDVEGEDDIIACAFKANGTESLMFKHSNGVCSLATEGVYNPKHASCDGEEVFIINPLDVCFTPLGTATSGHQYYSELCETNCGSSGILTDDNGDEVNPDAIPDEIVECCPTATSPCLYSVDRLLPSCGVERYCHFLGMTLPSAVPGPQLDQLRQIQLSSNDASSPKILVNVRGETAGWYHFPGEVMVNSDEWDTGLPKQQGPIVLNNNGKLEPVSDSELVSVVCQELEKLPACSK